MVRCTRGPTWSRDLYQRELYQWSPLSWSCELYQWCKQKCNYSKCQARPGNAECLDVWLMESVSCLWWVRNHVNTMDTESPINSYNGVNVFACIAWVGPYFRWCASGIYNLITWPIGSEWTLPYATSQWVEMLLTFYIIHATWLFDVWK